ncbi:IS110 family transposase [Streptomyces armeniacus]|uniref:IS110 family transposase n=1 Tax=Streptomyces armeniacus TaxID=83291 RepID=A0A345XZ86_9ACTN|nr:IS110 family transposase [Streptomyces armeniacus]AXK36952.1 IS110 family transposase [Streptomyces armeniacus]
MARNWAGTDIGKVHHHTVVLDSDGEVLLSRKVVNDEPELLSLIRDVLEFGDVVWAVDVADGMAALLVDLLLNHEQTIVYLPGLAVNRASVGYRGLGKTDAKDARVIADQARMRRDLHILTPESDLAAELRVMTDRRADLVQERTRKTNRLHAQVLSIFPVLERALELTNIGPLVLLSGYQTPAALRRSGRKRLTAWLRHRKVRSAEVLAAAAVDAAERQHTQLPGEAAIARVVCGLALEVIGLHEKIHELDKLIETRFHEHELAPVISSMPGIGPLLGAEFLAATGGDLTRFASADRLATFAGVAPVPRDSGNVNGNLHRPRRYHRGLQRVFYRSAMISIRSCPESRVFYDRKRAENKTHKHAVLALARRRVNVLFAMIRDRQCYHAPPSVTTAA